MKSLTLIVVGTVASDPYAGMAWMHMQIILGLRRLGHDVYYYETTSTWPYNPKLQTRVNNVDYAIPYLKGVLDSFDLADKWAYRSSFSLSKEWYGMEKTKAEELLAKADFVFNISGATRFTEENLKVGPLVYYGTDPVYHEIKYEAGDVKTTSIIDEHDYVLTYGENIGLPGCSIPPLPNLKGRTRQPIILDYWKNSVVPRNEFTTVGNWKQEGRDLVFNGATYYWSKHHEFLKFLNVPLEVKQPIEVAMNLSSLQGSNLGKGTEVPSHALATDEYSLLISHGWKLIDAPSFTTNPWSYRDYLMHSKGEFSFAKDQNIRLKSGWFSERSACYLASGRPVITQDTGFGSAIPTGVGLFSFNTMEEIKFAFDAINSNYEKHSKAASEIANEYFKAEKVLNNLLSDLGA